MPPRRNARAEAQAAEEERVREIVAREIAAREQILRDQLVHEMNQAALDRNDQGGNDQPSMDAIDENNNSLQNNSIHVGFVHPSEAEHLEPMDLLLNASTETINEILARHGVRDTLHRHAAMEKLRQIIRTIGVMLNLPYQYGALTVMEAKELHSPPWMRRLRRKGMSEDDIHLLVNDIGIVTNEDVSSLSIPEIDAMNLRVSTKNKLLAVRAELLR